MVLSIINLAKRDIHYRALGSGRKFRDLAGYDKRTTTPNLLWLLLSLLALTSANINANANAARDRSRDNLSAEQMLDQRTVDLTYSIYKQLLENTELTSGVSRLHIARSTESDNLSILPPQEVAFLYQQMPALFETISDGFTHQAFRGLLYSNQYRLAQDIYQQALNEADYFTVAALDFELARYYFARQDWTRTALHLDKALSSSALGSNEQSFAYILHGVLLQYEKKHREALKYYEAVNRESRHYPVAQLNAAIVNIRQGWWTDAHIIIENLIKEKDAFKLDKEFVTRLYITLGYSLIRNEFYRNARETFRNISINSHQANQALMGLALAAANQEDYVGALNALNILKERNIIDIYSEEAYLLLPFTYSKLNQGVTANAAYTDAIQYYENRIATIDRELQNHQHQGDPLIIELSGEKINLGDYFPTFLFDNYQNLKALLPLITNRDLREQTNTLMTDYETIFSKMTAQVAEIRKRQLNSYLSQARYGLAKLYDEQN